MNKFSAFVFIISLLTLLHPKQSAAQNEPELGSLSLKQCIDIAQQQSPLAKATRYALIASKWQYRSYRADLYPSLTLSGNAPNYNKSIFSNVLDNGEIVFSSRTQSEASAQLSIEQNIRLTGGTISVSSGITRLGVFAGEDSYFWQSTPLVVGLEQPLFQFNNFKWRHRLEPLEFEIAQKDFVEEMEGLAVQVTQRFFDVYLAKINLQNARFNVSRNDSIYKISQGRYSIGTIAENELLQSELALRNAESALIQSKIAYQQALNNFKILLGYSTDVKLKLTPPEKLPDISVNIEKAKRLALQNNSEALTYKLNELQAKRDLALAKSEGGFSATLRAQYGLNQTSSVFSHLYENPQNRQFFTIGFDIPIYNWGKHRAQINAARNQQQAVANSITYQRQQFLQNVVYRVNQFLQLRDQVLLASQSATIARRRYNVAQKRYLIGKIDLTNLFIAQDEKDSARRAYIRALGDFWTGWYSLRQLTLYNFKQDKPITYHL